jgi:hypothetical protein
VAFVRELTAAGASTGAESSTQAERQAWALFCQSLLASNEFIYLR